MHLSICGMQYPPYLFIFEDGKVITGIFADLLYALSRSLNFTFNFIDVTGNTMYFTIRENTTMIDLFYRVESGYCHFLWAPLALSPELEEIVAYTAPVYDSDTIILSGAPSDDGSSAATWELMSASPQLVGGLFVIMAVLSVLTFLNERKIWKNASHQASFWNVLWLYFGGIFLEPFLLKPVSHATRIFMAYWWICVVILVSLIGGNLRANLAITDHGTIDNIEAILAKPSLRPYFIDGTAYDNEFKLSNDPLRQGVYQQALKTGGIVGWLDVYLKPDAIESVRKGQSVMILPGVTCDIIISKYCPNYGRGQFYISNREVSTMSYTMIMTKGFPTDFKEKLNKKLRYFATMQLTVPSKRAYAYRYENCLWKPSDKYKSGNDIVLISSIWVIGMALSGVVLLVEITIPKFTKERKSIEIISN